jgi:hypothetical protein
LIDRLIANDLADVRKRRQKSPAAKSLAKTEERLPESKVASVRSGVAGTVRQKGNGNGQPKAPVGNREKGHVTLDRTDVDRDADLHGRRRSTRAQ